MQKNRATKIGFNGNSSNSSKLLNENKNKKEYTKKMKIETRISNNDFKSKKKEEELNDEEPLVYDEEEKEVENSQSNKTFKDLGLIPELCEATEKMNFKKPTPIQEQSIPWALQDRDIIGLAQTGSGKTAAFALPILQSLMKNPQPLFACVMSPTRELAVQIARHFEGLGAVIGVKCVVIVGGLDTMDQALALAKKPHIVVGTPGRILYHLEHTKGFSLRTLKYLVMDEADRLLGMDFDEEITKILTLIPKERRTYLFSATMTSKVEKLQRASLVNPVRIEVCSKYSTVDTLVQHYLFVPAKYKDCYLAFLLNEFSGNSTMVFAATRKEVQRLALMLRTLGFGAIPLHGQLTQSQRLGSLNKFSTGERKILIATDVASRGLDISGVDVVINYDIPSHPKDYIHRVGRTARGQRGGRAISIVSQYDVELYQRIEHLIQKKLDRYPCEEDQALVLLEKVTEAQRLAAIQLRESGVSGKKVVYEGDEEGSEILTKKRKAVKSNEKKEKPKKKRKH